ncbi:hypothetical protein [Paenibacillus taichungensis]|uniref:hypothetical protein n=1 Tax=Paenibacillus taichungensis TaxID=484184 RepID=UPI0035D83760
MDNSRVTVKRVLVQGDVSFNVSCNDLMALVTPEQAANDEFMENWFADRAFKMIDNASVQAEFSNEIRVDIPEVLADTLTGNIITNEQWDQIRKESSI